MQEDFPLWGHPQPLPHFYYPPSVEALQPIERAAYTWILSFDSCRLKFTSSTAWSLLCQTSSGSRNCSQWPPFGTPVLMPGSQNCLGSQVSHWHMLRGRQHATKFALTELGAWGEMCSGLPTGHLFKELWPAQAGRCWVQVVIVLTVILWLCWNRSSLAICWRNS